ncbi:hypothetical protein NDU88_003948 [Pleurodeles waltl]|uniref:Uncharacterized protein n=1 Tax=Pleurodeles waltl TaxID=8319 RepID=A0AAV7M4V4_PLEWA|nr:hypothetical protein NDU88_003948 [Pleurodeles waltl]
MKRTQTPWQILGMSSWTLEPKSLAVTFVDQATSDYELKGMTYHCDTKSECCKSSTERSTAINLPSHLGLQPSGRCPESDHAEHIALQDADST